MKDSESFRGFRMGDVILRKADLKRMIGVSDVTIRLWEKQGTFPRRFVINPGGRQVGWLKTEVDAWVEERANSRSQK
jgi:predicted DNA-binding transcriptional regulator AlpA